MTEHLDIKMKKLKKRRRSYYNQSYAKTVVGDSGSVFNGEDDSDTEYNNGRCKSMPPQH